MDETTVITLAFAMMFGALFGWLAPASVSLALTAAVLFGYYYPPRWVYDPLAPYGVTVRTMERRW